MEYWRLGSTGPTVSPLCLGAWRFGTASSGILETDRETTRDLPDTIRERGIDVTNGDGDGDGDGDGGEKNERWVGEWFADRDREDAVIASNVRWHTRGAEGAG